MMVEKAHSNDLEKMTSPDCSIAIEIAVSWAYNDAKRTMHGITKDDREEAEDAIVKEFKAYFTIINEFISFGNIYGFKTIIINYFLIG